MKLSPKQLKTFHRIQRKHNVSAELLLRNMPAILRFVHYAITPHPVLIQKLVRIKNRVFLRYNNFRKLFFDASRFKKSRRSKRLRSQWSKKLVTYLKARKTVEYVQEELTAETKLHEEDVSKQLKEQLELLKSGKRIVPLLEDAEQKDTASKLHLVSKSSDCDLKDDDENAASDGVLSSNDRTDDVDDCEAQNYEETQSNPQEIENSSPDPSKPQNNEISENVSSTPKIPIPSERGNGKFIDMLISKVKSTADDASDVNFMEPAKRSVRASREENSSSSSDFFGFEDNERILGTFPGMLSTPLVRNRNSNAAFESETLNAFLRDNSLETSTTMDLPHRPPEDGLVSARTIPPKLDMPALPEGLQGLRTVAERRIFLQRTRNVKYCVINNVGTVFRELQKRQKGHRINKNAIEALQNSCTMPLTRSGWKASSWLLTDEGNYYFQTISVDGTDYRLSGSRANNANKYKKPHFNDLRERISSTCTNSCVDRITFRALRPIRTLERRSKLSDASKRLVYKACPLSQKIFQHSRDNELAFNSLEVVRIPQVELEVFPQLQKPLNDIAKRYLQLILPYDGISREWAEFSVSTLLDRGKEDLAVGMRKSFTFKVPYANDRDTVLVRRIFSRCEPFEGQLDKSTLSFRKEIDDKKDNGQSVDELDEECADVLTDMLNSVAIGCSENSFLKDDPDNIYQNLNNDDVSLTERTVKKSSTELHQQQQAVGPQHRKQSRLLMELKRLNATIIDAAASKSDEGGLSCEKECCRLGCVCASLNEGTTVRQHCGKQKCILDCNCKCPGIMRLETDGRTITTEDAFMLRRQATAKLARMEKEFTSTIVLTGSETLLINESQYDKKRRCTKVPKRYGDFVDPDESELDDCKASRKTEETLPNLPLEPIMVNEKIYCRLKHCTVNIKRLRAIKDLALWCMIHQVYNCFCRGQATDGTPIVVEKQEDLTGGTTTDETATAVKSRTLYSFDKEESKTKPRGDASSNYESESNESTASESLSLSSLSRKQARAQAKAENVSRLADNDIIESFLSAKLNHCRRVVPIPRNTYIRRNKKRVAHVQLFIAQNETEETKLNLSEHVLRSVYYHKSYQNGDKRKSLVVNKKETNADELEAECEKEPSTKQINKLKEKRKSLNDSQGVDTGHEAKRSRLSIADVETGASLLLINQYKDGKKKSIHKTKSSESLPSSASSSQEQITVPKISQIFSLNTNSANGIAMGTDIAAAAAADIPKQSTEATASVAVSSEAFKSVFQVVIRNMNTLVSKKMQDIDMALRRESKSIPVPNDEILCIIRWNNFLTSYLDGFIHLWEIQTAKETFLVGTVRNVMPLVLGALSVVNIHALSNDRLPLLARMVIQKTRNAATDGLAVVMQGQKLFWYVKGFLRPDKDRICPKPTPETHPLLTKKINVLCRLLINQQINEHKKRQEMALKSQPPKTIPTPTPSSSSNHSNTSQQNLVEISPRLYQANLSTKLKVLPIQRNISDHAATILEQMVIQAYGVVQSNVVFRKVQRKEIPEICQPATLTLDHHWLVLDISTDFSHIFIPELKDLLTLDRIQKVISYAVNKNRIVKMQFSQKALFSAYVAPISRRKLYFGPFRSSNHSPKLVLLQSVDGQMMLREVYEKKHSIAERADKTTGFWLMQKRGKVLLDVLNESVNPLTAGSQDEVVEILDDDVTFVPQQHQDEASTSQNQKDADNDDDCVIIEDDASKERMHFTISYTDNSALVVVPSNGTDEKNDAVENINNKFTLLKPALTQNFGSTQQDPIGLRIAEQLPAHFSINIEDIEKAVASPDTNVLSVDRDVMIVPACDVSEATTVVAAAEANELPKQIRIAMPGRMPKAPESTEPIVTKDSIGAGVNAAKDVPIPQDTAKKLATLPTPAIQLNRNVTIRKIPVGSGHTSSPTANQKEPTTLIRKSLPASKMIIQYNPKRLSAPLNRPTLKPIAKPAPSNPKAKATAPYRTYPVQKQLMVSKVMSTQLCPQPKQKSQPNLNSIPQTSTAQQSSTMQQTDITRQPLTGQRGLFTPVQGGLIVRTPTAINTSIRKQQQRDLIRQPVGKQSSNLSLLKPITPGVRMRMPIVPISSANISASPVQPPSKSQTNPSNHAQDSVLKNALIPIKMASVTRKQPYTTTQQVQFIRYMKNQAKLVSKLNETIAQPICESPQSDPLQITEESSEGAVSDLLQPQLPSEVKTVRIAHPTLREKFDVQSLSTTTSQSPQVSGYKRNSLGSILQPSAQLVPKTYPGPAVTTNGPATVVTPLTENNPTESAEFKGIPIDLPRMKKFAIMSSPNTTVITPPTTTPKSNEVQLESPTSRPEVVEKPLSSTQINKSVVNATTVQNIDVLKNGGVSPAISNKSLMKTIPTAVHDVVTKVKSEIVTEYGYFQANIEGLPKFVVKRVNDDFLVKVPNFNGILKLNGLQTVYNYLNQYTTQKCGKTSEDIANLKWTFKVQDRSRLTNVKPQIQPKPSFNNKVSPSTQPQPQSTSPLKATTNNSKMKQIEPSSVVLVDDE